MLIIHNPAAGRAGAARLGAVVGRLREAGAAVELVRTQGPGHATVLAREGAGRGLVVAAGGDGTIAEVAGGLVGGTAALGVIPLGTANVLAHEYGLAFAPAAVSGALLAGVTAPLWPGWAVGAAGARGFVQMVGIGFDAQVVHRLPLALKRALGRGAYVVQTLRELGRYPFPRIRVVLDGVAHEAAGVIVSKGRLYAGPYRLMADADPGGPGFWVALFAHGTVAATLLYGAALPLNQLGRAPGVTLHRCGRVAIAQAGVPVQADGDGFGLSPLHISDAAGALRLIVPGDRLDRPGGLARLAGWAVGAGD